MTKIEVCNNLDQDIQINVIKSLTSDIIYVTLLPWQEETGIVKKNDYNQFEIPEKNIA